MARNKLSDLRDHLFAALEGLSDPDKPMEIERAKAIAEVAQTIINSAKVEVDAMKAIGGSMAPGGFFAIKEEGRELPRIERRREAAG